MDASSHLTNVIGALSLAIAGEVENAMEASTQLTSRELAALTTLANWADGSSIEVLRVVSGLSQPGCARLVDRLQAIGLVRRAANPADGRVTAVHITAHGRRVVTTARGAREAVADRWLAGLTRDERKLLSHLVDRLLERAHAEAVEPAEFSTLCCRLCDPVACGMPEHCPAATAQPKSFCR